MDFDGDFSPPDLDWRVLDVGGSDLPPVPPEPSEGPREPRRPQDPRRVPERTTHALTWAICAVALAFSALSMITLQITRGGGGIGSAYVLAAGFGLVFLGVFYAGGLWLGQRIEAGRRRAR